MPDPTGFRDERSVDPMLPRPFRVTETTREAPGVSTLMLVPLDGGPSISFAPGQIGMIGLPGIGEVPISFSSDPAERTRVAMTIRAVGAVTSALVALSPGAGVGLRGPFGRSWPLAESDDRDMVVIAGGLGLCPLRSLVVEAATRRARLRSLTVVHGARTPNDLLFKVDLEAWRRRPGLDLLLTVEEPDSSWPGDVGTVTAVLDRAVPRPEETVAMLCGPDAMLHDVGLALEDRGVATARIWVTMERNMKCAVGLCGHCQFGSLLLCREGPVLRFDRVAHVLSVGEM